MLHAIDVEVKIAILQPRELGLPVAVGPVPSLDGTSSNTLFPTSFSWRGGRQLKYCGNTRVDGVLSSVILYALFGMFYGVGSSIERPYRRSLSSLISLM